MKLAGDDHPLSQNTLDLTTIKSAIKSMIEIYDSRLNRGPNRVSHSEFYYSPDKGNLAAILMAFQQNINNKDLGLNDKDKTFIEEMLSWIPIELDKLGKAGIDEDTVAASLNKRYMKCYQFCKNQPVVFTALSPGARAALSPGAEAASPRETREDPIVMLSDCLYLAIAKLIMLKTNTEQYTVSSETVEVFFRGNVMSLNDEFVKALDDLMKCTKKNITLDLQIEFAELKKVCADLNERLSKPNNINSKYQEIKIPVSSLDPKLQSLSGLILMNLGRKS